MNFLLAVQLNFKKISGYPSGISGENDPYFIYFSAENTLYMYFIYIRVFSFILQVKYT